MPNLDEALEYLRGWEQQQFPVSISAIDTIDGCGGYLTGHLRLLNEEVMFVWSDDEQFMHFSLEVLKTATEITLQRTKEGTSILFVLPAGHLYITDIVSRQTRGGHA